MILHLLALVCLLLPGQVLAEPVATKPIVPLVDQKPLHAPLLDSIGFGVKEGALATTLWNGSTPEEITALLEQVVEKPLPAAGLSLLRKLAISPAPLAGKAEGVWLARRFTLLRDLGEDTAFAELWKRVPSSGRKSALAQLEAEQLLLQADISGACQKISVGLLRYPEHFWVQGNAFCLAQQKKTAEAELALQVWREKISPAGDAAFPFDEAVRTLLGEKIKIAPLATLHLSPLEAALAAQAGLGFAANLDREKGAVTPAVARFLARKAGGMPLHARVQLMDRVFLAGIVPVTELAELYQKMPLKPEVEARALKEKKFPASAVETRALSYRLVQKKPALAASFQKRFPARLAARLWPQATELAALKPEKSVQVALAHKAFDIPVSEVVWNAFATQPEHTIGANAVALELLAESASSRRVGETVLRALVLTPYARNSVTFQALLSALKEVGLRQEAAQLALELVVP